MFKKFFNWITSPLKALVKKQHDERKAMPEYYHDKLCLFGAWIPEESVNRFYNIFINLFEIVIIGTIIGFLTIK